MNNVYLYEMFYGYTEFERNPVSHSSNDLLPV